ncbi:MAG TPA: methyltransferase domain-containing protein [Myxococcaceae bacterium]
MRPHQRPARKAASRRPAEHRVRPVREDLAMQAALEAYSLFRRERWLADRALEHTLRPKRNLYANERRAVSERVYATVRRQRTIDHLLDELRPGFHALPSSRQDLLRLHAARVLEGESPATVGRAAALDDADARALEQIPKAAAALERLPADRKLALLGSLPDFLAKRFREELGPDAEAAVAAMNTRAPLCARTNTLKGTREALMQRLREEGVDCRPAPLSPLGIFLDTRLNAFSLKSFKEGFFELQDEGSQLLGQLVDPPPTRVVDACAGAGGKSLQLSAEMKNRGELFALDVDGRRLEELKRRARRDGVHNVRIREVPAEREAALAALEDLRGKADRVLVDAPCSGTGTFRRKPDARYRLSPEELAMHLERQRALLEQFSTLVKPGGRLIYGTCSILRAENEDVVEGFLSRHPEFSLVPAETRLPAPGKGPPLTRGGYLRLYTHLHGTDGFFGAILGRAKT